MGREQKVHLGIRPEEFRFGFPPETIEILQRITDSPTALQLDIEQRIKIRSAASFLTLADSGIQKVDFSKSDDGLRVKEKQEARSIVLDILYHRLTSGSLPYNEAVEAHRRILSFREILRDIDKGLVLPGPQREMLPQMIDFLAQVQQKLPQDSTPKGYLPIPGMG